MPNDLLFDAASAPEAMIEGCESLPNIADGGFGVVYTRREVVEFILDLCGYTENVQLSSFRVLEPSFGKGDFLSCIVERLVREATRRGRTFVSLKDCVVGVELREVDFLSTRTRIRTLLESLGASDFEATFLVDSWLIHGDFLTVRISGEFDFVIGNPPYVRQELIGNALLAEYRRRYSTMYDRADLYVPFFERGLRMLSDQGKLGFICSDRWMKNRYGAPLREFVSSEFHLEVFVDMYETDAFHSDVSAYPAITVIKKGQGKRTRVCYRPTVSSTCMKRLARKLASEGELLDGEVKEFDSAVVGREPWLLESGDLIAIVRRLESQFPLIEQVGCKVGIGVATGADKAFIGDFASLDVEPCRKIPLVQTKDIRSGVVEWRGKGVINPFQDSGKLVDLSQFPRLKRYLEERRDVIEKRHVAQKDPRSWFRTIDRIWPELVNRPKLLIPDIKGESHVVLDSGRFYPHHNLYYITSEDWDLNALMAVLLSRVARLFVQTYSVKMRGGYLRFQAQYLRRIRLPEWGSLDDSVKARLKRAGKSRDLVECNESSYDLFRMSANERFCMVGAIERSPDDI